jgi:hypothetical protein
MIKQSGVCAFATFFISIASAQVPTRDFPDAANPTATPPAANSPRTGTSDRPPGATTATSEKMQPEMDSVAGPKSPPGVEKK